MFPFQLFDPHPALHEVSDIFLIEEWLLFHQFPFHKQKLVLHRASMQNFASVLREKQFNVTYIPATDSLCDVTLLIDSLASSGLNFLQHVDVVDDWLEQRISGSCVRNGVEVEVFPTPYFLNQKSETDEYFDKRKRYFQTDFYIDQRKKRHILVDDWQKPRDGSWSFDSDNLKKVPKGMSIPRPAFRTEDKFVKEAITYVEENFPDNYGSLHEFRYATSHSEAEKWMDEFFRTCFDKFGDYEDAIVKEEAILFHSVLTPYLNTGLLTPQQVLHAALEAGEKYQIPVNSL